MRRRPGRPRRVEASHRKTAAAALPPCLQLRVQHAVVADGRARDDGVRQDGESRLVRFEQSKIRLQQRLDVLFDGIMRQVWVAPVACVGVDR